MKGLGRFIFWDFPRASWQYDVMVGLILMFIFLIPRDFFRDQPKPPNISMLRGGFWIDSALLAGVPQDQLLPRATDLVNKRYKTHAAFATVEPIYDDSEQEIKGYMAFTRP
jgi:hypothetical protein